MGLSFINTVILGSYSIHRKKTTHFKRIKKTVNLFTYSALI